MKITIKKVNYNADGVIDGQPKAFYNNHALHVLIREHDLIQSALFDCVNPLDQEIERAQKQLKQLRAAIAKVTS